MLTIYHRHGRNVSVHATDREANEAVLGFCKRRWGSDGPAKPMPDEPSALIANYFADSGGSWSVEERDLERLRLS